MQAEAAQLERLRRQIAEMAAKGEVASPKLLADFARIQKVYLDKKIGFERERRNVGQSGPSSDATSAEGESRCGEGSPAKHETSAKPEKQAALPSSAMFLDAEAGTSSKLRLAILWIVLLSAIAVAWYYASHP